MKQDLANGVHLTVLPTTQFKTVSVLVSFCSPVQLATLTTRSLLADLLETSSAMYPTQTALAAVLSNMYGANFNTNVTKMGNLAQFQFALTLANGRYLEGQPNLLADGFHFLNEVMLNPLVSTQNGITGFDQQTFDRQKENLAIALRAVSDDKMLYARLQAQHLHFGDTAAAYPSAGRLADVESLTAQSVYNEYRRILTEDEVFIYVMGDVDADEVATLLDSFDLTDRPSMSRQITIPQEAPSGVTSKVEHQPITQAKLDLIYHLPVHYGDNQYFAAQVFNGLFGGTPLSLLFTNVREKKSLAYYANSGVNFFNQTLLVQAGIDGEQAVTVQQIIGEQLADLAAGKFSVDRMSQVKETLINQREAAQDAPRLVVGSELLGDLTARPMTVSDWIDGINAVTAQDVAVIAQQTSLATSYLLSK
ncbi:MULTISPECIES: EF-P 5-aminopentanol modification-associated protein YfmF [Furfurilactobacillus]|uniref:Insulinase family protein n=1 Tax=Furfurilactobacillus rossiae TaxID=231049 RepID=A0A7C9IPN2_9LACO|nr:pitrilysin family protein [Furfurilactobacillus milii]MYV04496.1 insulinase family protein [Furfurilactobacillus milii]